DSARAGNLFRDREQHRQIYCRLADQGGADSSWLHRCGWADHAVASAGSALLCPDELERWNGGFGWKRECRGTIPHSARLCDCGLSRRNDWECARFAQDTSLLLELLPLQLD